VANGNLAIRHLGVPTVTVPMGVMADIGMPVGLTFAGRAYDDNALLRLASAFEATGKPTDDSAAHPGARPVSPGRRTKQKKPTLAGWLFVLPHCKQEEERAGRCKTILHSWRDLCFRSGYPSHQYIVWLKRISDQQA
jgi:hypothetical protein